MALVLYVNDSPLMLMEVERNPDGTIAKGWVVNGAWKLHIKNGEAQTKDGNYIVNRWPIETLEEVEVQIDGDYNETISAANTERKARADCLKAGIV